MNLTVKPDYIDAYKSGYPLISKESIVEWNKVNDEGTIVNLMDAKKKFIAKGYYGIQNKGFGWVLSSNANENIDRSYFIKKIKSAFEYRKDFYGDEEKNRHRY